MFFVVFPKSIETVKICGELTKNASLIHPSVIETNHNNLKYIISFDSIIRECLVFDYNDNLIDCFATIFTDLEYNNKPIKEYITKSQ